MSFLLVRFYIYSLCMYLCKFCWYQLVLSISPSVGITNSNSWTTLQFVWSALCNKNLWGCTKFFCELSTVLVDYSGLLIQMFRRIKFRNLLVNFLKFWVHVASSRWISLGQLVVHVYTILLVLGTCCDLMSLMPPMWVKFLDFISKF